MQEDSTPISQWNVGNIEDGTYSINQIELTALIEKPQSKD